MSSISDGFDELALPRRKSPAGWTLPPRRRSGVLRSGLGLSPRGSETGSRAGQKSFRPGACFFLHRKPNIFHDLREAVATLEDTERTAWRVMGGAHPITTGIELSLRNARAVLHAHDIVSILN